ncbi:TRAP transporter large permease [Bordetella bronchiseptica]|uniref:TRAP transporter large permease n=1 Tax=Bordetella bronchiseptica TaxID=518 RepID=UPI00028FD45F|nr:TRAP transporter large permease [Bordetella bronchiseptica]KDC74900.1 TRAP transporter, DctM subunit [Bordetella bronchiseptica MBORD632]CCN23457.1 putative membrane protein [Bordetella bronchiseptica 1289]
MDAVLILTVILGLFGLLLVLGIPIFAALGVPSILGIYLVGGASALNVVPSVLHRGIASYSLICIPLFILMGETLARTSIGARLYTLFYTWLSRVRCSLAIASVGASAIFGAMSGVSVAGAATIGRVAIPEMLKRRYDPGLAGGSVAAAGSLALLIPPSVGFVLYGEIASQSIGKLFSAAIVPGLLLSVLMMLYLYGLSRIKPSVAPDEAQKVSWRKRWQALRDVWAAIVLIVAVLGTIYLGIATPTEASGLGAAGALLVALGYRELDRAKLREIVRSTIVTSSMILLIVAAALLFGHVLMRLQAPQMLIAWVAALAQPDWVILLLILVFLLIVGMFLDIVSIILITTPIVLPVITSLGLDPIWFGVVMIIMCEMAVITPPIGLNLYVIKGVAPEISLRDITMGALPFVLVEALAVLILVLFPQLALWLPSHM